LSYRWVQRHPQAVILAAVEPIAVLILVAAPIDLPDAGCLGDHALRDAHSLIKPGGAFVELVIILYSLAGVKTQRE
jgi:hypothetical protein